MGRLRLSAPTLQLARPALAVAAPDRDSYRRKVLPWRAWYNTAEWKALRLAVLKRDRWTCQQTGVICAGRHPEPNSPVADHKIPHRGDRALFFDVDNIQTVTKAYHDSQKQRQERAAQTRGRG